MTKFAQSSINTGASIVTTVLVLIVGSYSIAYATDFGAAWTTESARKIDIRKTSRKLPPSQLVDVNGESITPLKFSKRIQLVDFIYTQCPTTCIGLGLEYRRLQSDLKAAGMDSDVQLISISFDIDNDTPLEINDYLTRFNADRNVWDGYVFSSEADMKPMLDILEVTVIPDEKVGFIHNAAIYMIEDGHVVDVFDYQSREQLMNRLRRDLG